MSLFNHKDDHEIDKDIYHRIFQNNKILVILYVLHLVLK